jgi:hypothetical protein
MMGENNVNVLKLDGALLDFWVAKSENLEFLDVAPEEKERLHHGSGYWHPSYYHPSSDWSQGGPIVANEWYGIEDALLEWFGAGWPYIKGITAAPLLWMMRAYVKTKFGNEVEDVEHLPEYLSATIAAQYLSPMEDAYSPSGGARLWPSWLVRERGRHSNTGC